MDAILADCDFANSHVDDILTVYLRNSISGMGKVSLKKIPEYGFQLSEENYELFLPKVKYLGQIIDTNGRHLDPSNENAIKNIPSQSNVTRLQIFPGQVNHY